MSPSKPIVVRANTKRDQLGPSLVFSLHGCVAACYQGRAIEPPSTYFRKFRDASASHGSPVAGFGCRIPEGRVRVDWWVKLFSMSVGVGCVSWCRDKVLGSLGDMFGNSNVWDSFFLSLSKENIFSVFSHFTYSKTIAAAQQAARKF